MIRTNVFLTQEQREALKKLSQHSRLSVAEHIRRAIDEYLEHRREAKTNINDEQ